MASPVDAIDLAEDVGGLGSLDGRLGALVVLVGHGPEPVPPK